ncbi:stalk domain-containing protein [Paenibacillus sp. FSL L8-0436]
MQKPIYTPARAVAEALGATVNNDAKTKTVRITSKEGE